VRGVLGIALARTFRILDPELKNPHAVEWEHARKVFDELI